MSNERKLIQQRDEWGWVVSYYAPIERPEMSREEAEERERLAEGWEPLGRFNGD